jgi:hypothetical protein
VEDDTFIHHDWVIDETLPDGDIIATSFFSNAFDMLEARITMKPIEGVEFRYGLARITEGPLGELVNRNVAYCIDGELPKMYESKMYESKMFISPRLANEFTFARIIICSNNNSSSPTV